MVMAKDLNNAGKDLYKGKKSYHELTTGARKAEKLDEWKIVKSKTMRGNPLSKKSSQIESLLGQEDIGIDGSGYQSIVNLAQTLEIHAAINRLEDKSANSIVLDDPKENSKLMGNFSSVADPFEDTAVETFYKDGK